MTICKKCGLNLGKLRFDILVMSIVKNKCPDCKTKLEDKATVKIEDV